VSKERVVFALLAVLLLVGLAAGENEVILKSRRFVPAAGLGQSLLARIQAASSHGALHVTGEDTAPGRMHVIIQLEDVPTVERRIELIDAGVRLLSYIPNRSWLAGIETDKLTAIGALPGVRAITEILPQDKLAHAIREQGINAYSRNAAARRNSPEPGEAKLVALLFEDVALDAGVAAIEELGGTVIDRDSDLNCLVLYLPVDAVDALAACDCVKWIDQHYEPVDLNDGVRAAINANAVQIAPYNLTGTSVVLGQWESGHPDDTHDDLAGRVTNIQDGSAVTDHATLVAGTMIGSGQLLYQYRGVATAATVVSFRTWENIIDLRRQYRDAINLYGIDISNNSWGKVEWNVYKDYAGALDAIVRGDLGKPISMTWAVGNEGGSGSILCTAVAKNVVAVGATNSDDNSLWSLSNKGPTEDGRIKPDMVSPGCETRNGRKVWSTLPRNRYGGDCGTSLAAPSVSGTMALILEDWRGTHGGDPLPSTIKGLLLHTAKDLGSRGPDYAFGYGLIDAQAAIDLVRADTLDDVVVEDAVLRQGERDLYTMDIAPGAKALKATLVWDDYPADPLTAHALVNDLDLVVTGPDGRQYYPWTLDALSPEKEAQRIQADHDNNVEQVVVEYPAAGAWQITVRGTMVPQYHQTYSLLAGPSRLARVVPGRTVLSITSTLGQTVAEFDDQGNLMLRGTLTTGFEGAVPPSAFVIKDPDQDVAGYIDLDGNMRIRGELNELSNCDLSVDGFVVKDWFGNTVACVDMGGNLCLTGRLYQGPQP
jgi:hypothetical protein